MATTTVSSSAKRTSEQAGFIASPPPKHRKLNTSLALALSPPADSKNNDGAALLSFANDQPLAAQQESEQARIDHYRRTWVIEFDSDFSSLEGTHSKKRASMWQLFDFGRYDDREVQCAIHSPTERPLRLTCKVKLEGSWQHFQGCIDLNACEGKFVVASGSLMRTDMGESEEETETETDEDDDDEVTDDDL